MKRLGAAFSWFTVEVFRSQRSITKTAMSCTTMSASILLAHVALIGYTVLKMNRTIKFIA